MLATRSSTAGGTEDRHRPGAEGPAPRPSRPPLGQAPDLSGGPFAAALNSLCRSRTHLLTGSVEPTPATQCERLPTCDQHVSGGKQRRQRHGDHHRDEPARGSKGEAGPGGNGHRGRGEPGAQGGRPAASTAPAARRGAWGPRPWQSCVCLPRADTVPGRTALQRRLGPGEANRQVHMSGLQGHTHARTRAHRHACTHTRMHAPTHARTRMHAHTCTRTQTCSEGKKTMPF